MKARIRTKQKFTYPIHTVMTGNIVIDSFYDKKKAIELRKKLNAPK